ncbi:guanylate kinase [Imperialibacter roseus]|uniref:Guanylate kinase n=1 Tax=Imperialibacter roseus TaxID=1324217 RepID=A0ABZ0IJP5_9BACT|nr:guanylate kinase [Imperialibacter roseus]WOK05218.1 guanylate kinase [Imperialibacter roseus]
MRKAIIFTAPSGSGKTTLVKHLLDHIPSLAFSISATTRKPRNQEVNGKDYYFLSFSDFQSKIERDEFIEWEEVYNGSFYGTLKEEIDRIWALGKDVIFDVEVHGALNLKKYFEDDALAVFVKVPDLSTLQERLQKRDTETVDTLEKRLQKAKYEMTFEKRLDVTVLNDDLQKAKDMSLQIVKDFLA